MLAAVWPSISHPVYGITLIILPDVLVVRKLTELTQITAAPSLSYGLNATTV